MPGHRGFNSSPLSKGDPQKDFYRTKQRALAADNASGGGGYGARHEWRA
jgi:hypothetical protein